MSTIARHKYGTCSICQTPDTGVVKVAKDLVCLNCRRTQKAKAQAKKSAERNAVRSLGTYQKQEVDVPKGTFELQRWFEDRKKEMKGSCQHCGGRTQAGTPSYKCSVAHILPKAYFKSVATHPLNWIELCFYGKSCHTNLDNQMLDIMELNCFDEVIEKFIKIYPAISESERRRIPDILLQYLKDNT